MSVTSAVRTWLATCPHLATNSPIWVDWIGTEPPQYAIVPQPAPRVVEWYVDGASTRQYAFAIQVVFYTSADADRLANSGFLEDVAEWLEAKTNAGQLPTLGDGKTAELVEAVNAGFLYEQGESQTGIYQIICRLEYYQDAIENDESE